MFVSIKAALWNESLIAELADDTAINKNARIV